MNLGRPVRFFLIATGLFCGMSAAAPEVRFEADVLPILKARCQQCHGANVKSKALDLTSLEALLKGSDSGPVIVAGKRDDSRLYQLVRTGKMPPGARNQLSESEVAAIGAWIDQGAPVAVAAGNVTQHEIIPSLLLHCTACHGPQRREAGLDLRSKSSMLKGGKSGPAFAPGKPEESLIIRKIRSGAMPPKVDMLTAGVKPMSAAETEKLARWIALDAPEVPAPPDVAGTAADPLVTAKDRRFWSFQPPKAAPIPKVSHAKNVRNPIDAFVLQKLEAKGGTLSKEADRLTLIRRAAFDLTGLPPDPTLLDEFLADKRGDAYERMIDQLLASRHYGEKWGRRWLDVAGYADSEGGKLSADVPRTNAWRYRDYVIRAFNADKPYDRFLIEQLAGDELADYEKAPAATREIMDNLIATGFLRMAADSTSEREVNFSEDRLDVIADELEVLTSGVMGLTLKCARCHDHKYDPIPQRDYYRMVAVFKGAYDEHDWIPPVTAEKYGRYYPGRFLPFVEPGATPYQVAESERQREIRDKELQAEIKSLTATLDQKLEPVRKRILEERLTSVPKTLHDDLRSVLATPAEKRTETQKFLAGRFEKILKIELDDAKEKDPTFGREAEELEKRIKVMEARRQPEPKIRALWDRGEPSPTYIQRRGSATSFGPPVEPGVPSVLADSRAPFEIRPPWPGAKKTGRRLALARWLARPDHPLTARVLVNRVWKYHFGSGIVPSLGNFGKVGLPPSHPELLDWLSVEFVRQGWSIKSLHRLMMTSATYRQSSQITPEGETRDPDNRLFSRMTIRRLEAEEVSDTLLLVAGKLDRTPFGPPDPVMVRRDGLVTPIGGEQGWRRSIYVNQRRSKLPSLLEAFDLPPMSPACLERGESTVAPQALHLLNNRMVDDLAASFARQVEREAGADRQRQVERVYWAALSRPPSDEERRVSLEAIARFSEISQGEALRKFCHTLLNSAAFLYID